MTKRNKKKKLINVVETPTGPVNVMTGVTVTPDGVGIGEPATSEEMIPTGAELSDEERHKLEGLRGAAYMNAALRSVSNWMAPMLVSSMPGAGPLIGLGFGVKQLSDDAGVTGAIKRYGNGFSSYWSQHPDENIVSRFWNADDAGSDASGADRSSIFSRVKDKWSKDKASATEDAVNSVINTATLLPVFAGALRGVRYPGGGVEQKLLSGPLSKRDTPYLYLELKGPVLGEHTYSLTFTRPGRRIVPAAIDFSAEKTHLNIAAKVRSEMQYPIVKVGHATVNGLSTKDPTYIQAARLLNDKLLNKIGNNGLILDATRYEGQTILPDYTTITTTLSKLKNILNAFNIKDEKTTEFTDPDTGLKIRLNVISDSGPVIHDMYSFAHPRKYRDFAIKFKDKELGEYANTGHLGETMDQTLEQSADLVFDEYLNNPRLQNEYTTYKMGIFPMDDNGAIGLETRNLLWRNFIVNTPWYNSALLRKKILLTGEEFTPWAEVKQTQRMPDVARILGYKYPLDKSKYARKNIHDMTELFLTTPYRVINPINGVPFDEKFITSALGTNVTGRNMFHEDAMFGNTLSGSDRTGVEGVLAASVPVKILGISDVKKLLHILERKGFDEGAYNKFRLYSERLQKALANKDMDEIDKICNEAQKFAEESGLLVKLGDYYGYNQGHNAPNFLGMVRRNQYSLPILLGRSYGMQSVPMFGTLSYPLFAPRSYYTYELPHGWIKIGDSKVDFSGLKDMWHKQAQAFRSAHDDFNKDAKGLSAVDAHLLGFSNPDDLKLKETNYLHFNDNYTPVDKLDKFELRNLHKRQPRVPVFFKEYSNGLYYQSRVGANNVYGVPASNFWGSDKAYKKEVYKTGPEYLKWLFDRPDFNKNMHDSILDMYPNLSEQDVKNISEIIKNNYILRKMIPAVLDDDIFRTDKKAFEKDVEAAVKLYLYKDFGK